MTSSPESTTSENKMSPEYINLAKDVLRGITSKEIDSLCISTHRMIAKEFSNDFLLLPPEEEHPDCICVFEPTSDPKYFLNDKKKNQRTGLKLVLRAEAKNPVDFFKGMTKKVKRKKTKTFVTSAGISSSSELLERSQKLYEEFLDVVNDIVDTTRHPEDLFLKVINTRDAFERILIKTPSTPDKIKKVAKHRIEARARLYGEWRMTKNLFGMSYKYAYDLVEEFEGIVAADLIDRNIDNNLVYMFYVGDSC